jgi:hypothetical protein
MTIGAVSRHAGIAITDANEVCMVIVWLDADGFETDDLTQAVFAIGELPDKRWFMADLREFDTAGVQ